MIQRIQSLYLLLTVILMGILCFIPLASFLSGGEVYKLFAWGIRATGPHPTVVVPSVYMGILLGLSILVPLVTIFLYKRRLIQIRLCIVEMVLLVGMELYVVFYLYKVWKTISVQASHQLVFSVVDLFPLISLVLVYLAFRAIARDEALVRSMDRIR